jgi:hypothetical protein
LASLPDGSGGFEKVEATCAQIQDRAGNTIWSLDIIGPELIGKLEAVRRSGANCQFLAIPVAVPLDLDRKRPDRVLGARSDFLLHVLDVRPASSTFDLLGATVTERTWALQKLDAFKGEGISPGDYLYDLTVKGLGIVGLDDLDVLCSLIRFAVLQAVSCGTVGNAPARLHGLIVGPPSRGKKLVGLAARALNPVCVELSPAKSSPAGLVGASSQRDGAWRSQPGALPRACSGVVLLQDAHTWTRNMLGRLGAVLQEVIEDGVVRDSVAGGGTWEAQTSLLIDMNRQAQAWGSSGREAPLLDLIPLLMRLDMIVEIPDDPNKAWDVAGKMYRANTNALHLDEQPWVREARLVVAALREHHDEIDLEPTLQLMEEVHAKIGERVLNDRHEKGDVAARLTVTMRRFVKAAARASGRSYASPNDVMRAYAYVRHKLDFLKANRVRLSGCPVRDDIDAWLASFDGQVVQPSDLADRYEEATGRAVDERTIRRHVQKWNAKRVGKGRYLLPTRTTGQL